VRLFCGDGSGREWTFGEVRQALERARSEGLGHPLHIQVYGDVAIGISRRYMRGSSTFSKDEESQDEEGEGGDMHGGRCTREACSKWRVQLPVGVNSSV
jgi:hypothetical protein